MDKITKNFVNSCKEHFKNNLQAIILFGSRAYGNYSRKSDYDLIIITKKNQRGFKPKPPLAIIYKETLKSLKQQINKGGWALYFALKHTGKTLYATKAYKKLLKTLKISSKHCLQRYSKKNSQTLNQLKKLKNWNFIKWSYCSIKKLIFLISYARFKKSTFNFLKDINKNKDLFSKQELKDLKILHNKYIKHDNKLTKTQKIKFTKLTKKICNKIKELNNKI